MKLYANQLEKNVLPVQTTSEELVSGEKKTPVLDVVVTCNDAKTRFVLAVVNKHPDKAIEFAPDFAGLNITVPKQISATILSGSSPDDYNDIGAENRVAPYEKTLKVEKGKVSLPPHSLVLITLN
jgi:alpha-N-arabinofuranosidase